MQVGIFLAGCVYEISILLRTNRLLFVRLRKLMVARLVKGFSGTPMLVLAVRRYQMVD